MKVLQDECPPSTLEEINDMMQHDMGVSLTDTFSFIDTQPLGVASLAQVHLATLKETGQKVAVKFQHPRLDRFTNVDIETVAKLVQLVKKTVQTLNSTGWRKKCV